jgi:thiol:disulfide interchange protein DsbA
MYFAIKALNKNEELDPKVFDALAFNPQAFNDAAAAKTFGTSNGIDAATWDKAYGGFDSNANIAAVKGMVESFGIEGVPAIIVNGKYLVGGESVRTLQVVNKLIEMDKAAAPK